MLFTGCCYNCPRYYILFHIIFVLTKSWRDLWRNQILGVKLYYQKIRSPYAKAFVTQLIPQCSQKKKDRDIICKRPNNHIKSSRSFILSLFFIQFVFPFSLFMFMTMILVMNAIQCKSYIDPSCRKYVVVLVGVRGAYETS